MTKSNSAAVFSFLGVIVISPMLAAQDYGFRSKDTVPPIRKEEAHVEPDLAIPSDQELRAGIDALIQKAALESLHEVSLTTSLSFAPGSETGTNLSAEVRKAVTGRLEGMGLKIIERGASACPIVALNLTLIKSPDSGRHLGYYLELGIFEQVALKRPSLGDPPARTYSFHSAGQFTAVTIISELNAAYNELLDSLQRALEVAKQAP